MPIKENLTYLVYLPKSYYFKRVNAILKDLKPKKVYLVSEDYLTVDEKHFEVYVVKSLYEKALFLLRDLKKINQDYIVAANHDMHFFQCLYWASSNKDLISFDEGVGHLRKESRYYWEKHSFFGGQKKFILNKLTGFPIPEGLILNQSKLHYTLLPLDAHSHPLFNQVPLKHLVIKKPKINIKTIFLGTDTYWTFYPSKESLRSKEYPQALREYSDLVNNLKPDIYLMHPREDDDILKLLLKDIYVINSLGESSLLINALAEIRGNKAIVVYARTSGSSLELSPKVDLRLIEYFKNEPDFIKERRNFFQKFHNNS